MSSDNYYLIRRAGTRFAVSMEFASSEEGILAEVTHPQPIDSARIRWFDDLPAATAWARSQYSEYGVTIDVHSDAANDTWLNRLTAAAASLGDRFQIGYHANNEDGSVTMAIGPATVTVSTGADDTDGEQLWTFLRWLQLTTPASIASP